MVVVLQFFNATVTWPLLHDSHSRHGLSLFLQRQVVPYADNVPFLTRWHSRRLWLYTAVPKVRSRCPIYIYYIECMAMVPGYIYGQRRNSALPMVLRFSTIVHSRVSSSDMIPLYCSIRECSAPVGRALYQQQYGG